MKKHLHLYFILAFFCTNSVAQNLGFEAPAAPDPADWTVVTGTWNTTSTPGDVRTGQQSVSITSPATTGTTIANAGAIAVVPPGPSRYIITMAWAKSNTTNGVLYLGYRNGTTNTLNPSTATSGRPVNLTGTYSRITSVSAATMAPGSYGISMRAFRSATNPSATTIYVDDVFAYASLSAVPDTISPDKPVSPVCTVGRPNMLQWTNSTDTGANASGRRGVVVVRTPGTTASIPVFNAQAIYHPAGGSLGTSSFVQAGITWTVVVNADGPALTSANDHALVTGQTYTYAIASYDSAGNYSQAVIASQTPGTPMAYSGSRFSQTPIDAAPGASTVLAGRISIATTGGNGQPLPVNIFHLTPSGSTNSADITRARIYSTYSSPVFDTTHLFGSVLNPGGAISISGTDTLYLDSNYFWLVYDIAPSAAACNVLDAELQMLTINNSNYAPSNTTYPGAVSVWGPLSGTYTINPLLSIDCAARQINSISLAAQLLTKYGVSGPVVLNVAPSSGPYTGAVSFGAIPGASAVNTITLNGNGNTIQTVPTADTRHVVQLNGTRYLTLSGLRIVGQDATYGWGIHLFNNAGYDTIRHCFIDMSAITSTTAANSAGIVATNSATAVGTQGVNAERVVIINDTIKGAYTGVNLAGLAATRGMRNQVTQCTIMDFYANGIEMTYQDSALISQNDISRANRTVVTTFAGVEMGAGNTRSLVTRNKIHDTHNSASTQSGASYGVFFTACDAPADSQNLVTNNLIYRFNSASGIQYGLYNSSSDGVKYYHNTVVLDDALSTGGNARGFYQTTLASDIDLKNNIFYITRAGTGNKHCIYLNTATTTITSNHNVLYLSAAAGTNGIGYHTSSHSLLSDWQGANGGGYDMQSKDVSPVFVSTTAPLDYTPTRVGINNSGANVGVTVDITGAARGSNPDPGAYEFTPQATLDASISWSGPISPVQPGASVPIAVQITNNLADPVQVIEIAYTDGSATINETFSSLNILTTGKQVLTFSVPYTFNAVTSMRAYIVSVNGQTDAGQTNDTTGLQSICLGLTSGTYTINSGVATGGSNFQTFADAITRLNCGIFGPVTLVVAPGSGPYNEQPVFSAVPGASATNTVTIKGNMRTIQAVPVSANRALLRLDGADHFIIDSLRLLSLDATYGWGVHLTNVADSNTISNCEIDMSSVTSTGTTNSVGIVVSGSLTSLVTDGEASYNRITGNTISGGYSGISINAVPGSGAVGNEILRNTIRDFYTNGVELTENVSVRVEHNDIHRAGRTGVTTFAGIEIGAGNKRGRFIGNKIHDTHTSATTLTGAAYGIFSTACDAPVGEENLVANNAIYNFNSASGIQYGLYNSSSDGVTYLYNSILLDNPASTAGTTRGFYQTTEAARIVIRNNVFSITRAGTGAKYCLYFNTPASTIVSNYNILHMNAPAGTNGIGSISTTPYASLGAWKGANGSAYDQQSEAIDPVFNAPDNLRPFAGSGILGEGTPEPQVGTDMLGAVRSATAPTPGAYEAAGDFMAPTIVLGAIPNTMSTANRTLAGLAAITDRSGVNTAILKPRIYYKRSTDNNTYAGNTVADNGWKYTETSGTATPFSFTIDYSLLFGGSAMQGDTIQYFVAAQDLSANTNAGIVPGQLQGVPASVNLPAGVFPVTRPGSYRILPMLPGGTYSVGASGNYRDLTVVSELLEGSVLSGNVIFELQQDYTPAAEVFPVRFKNMNRVNPAFTVTIRPAASVSTPLVTEGETQDETLIDLNGVSRITFDGRPGGVGDSTSIRWVIRNRNTAVQLPVFRFINDARINTLQYLHLQSSNTLATSGTILFSTTTGTSGNDSNTVRYNLIGDRTDTLLNPVNAVYAAGTDDAPNDHISIYGNRIFNFSTNGIHIAAAGGGDGWKISNNHFYATDSIATAQASVRFLAKGVNNSIDSNTIGGSTALGALDPWINSGNIAWRGIVCTAGTTDTCFITHNRFRNIRLAGTGTGTYAGIEVTTGLVSIAYNEIGDPAAVNSIVSSLEGTHLGITITGATIASIYNNKISNTTSTGTTSSVGHRGISHTGTNTTQPLEIRNNTISKLSAATLTVSGSTSAMQGIYTDAANKRQAITGNIISGLSSNGGATGLSPTRCVGINVADAAGSGQISRNTITDLAHTGTSVHALAVGIHLFAGTEWTVANNMVSIGNLVSAEARVAGIMDSSAGVVNVYHNTVLISGAYAGANTAVRSHAYRRSRPSQANVYNNIFNNHRTGGGRHFAVGNTGGQYLSDYNSINSSSSATAGEWDTTAKDFTGWKAVSGRDLASIDLGAAFTSASDLHLVSPTTGNPSFAARPLASVTTDFDGEPRASAYVYMGADEVVSSPLSPSLPFLNGPVYTVGYTGNYLNLTAVANALNQSVVASDLVFELQSDYIDTTEAFPVNFGQFATNAGGNFTVTIRPASSVAAIVTSGDPGSTGFPLIRLNGTDRLTLDGRPGGTGTANAWTISNKRSAAIFSPAVMLMNNARHNTLRNLVVTSGNTLAASGTIVLGASENGGNDSNTISFNEVKDLGTGIPANAIYSAGSETAPNGYNRIENNRVSNFTGSGILVTATGNTSGWQISNNHVYYNQATVPATVQTGINFQASGSGNTISGNFIGGSAINAGGTAWSNSGSNLFMGIQVDADSGAYTLVQNNTIGNISKTATGAASFSGIRMVKGRVKLMDNTIGHASTANSIVNAGTSFTYGIEVQNSFGTADTVVISGNTVANMAATGTSAGSRIRGISFGFSDVTPVARITDNTVHHISTTGIADAYGVDVVTCTGMMVFPVTYGAGILVRNNTVYDIEARSNTAAATICVGLSASNFAGELSYNRIYNIRSRSAAPQSQPAVVAGLYTRFLSNSQVFNNMISVSGSGSSDSAQLNGILIAGNGGGAHFYYHNSVNVTNGTAATVSSFAFHRGQNSLSAPSAHPMTLRNNIFQNTVASAGRHFAIGVEDTAVVTAAASDWNVFNAADTSKLALWGATTGNLATWRTRTGSDANTKIAGVSFAAIATAHLHLVAPSIGDTMLAGIPVAGMTRDVDNDLRNAVKPYIGADENTAFPLPVVLVQFAARKAGSDVELSWATSSEKNAAFYLVERSVNNRDFVQTDRVKAQGQSSVLLRYASVDANAFRNTGAATLYYRLKMVDANGSYEYSKTAIVSADEVKKQLAVSAYPNPFSETVYLSVDAEQGGTARIRVADITGRMVLEQDAALSEGENILDLAQAAWLRSGVYFVQIETASGSGSFKLIKQ